jgi:hypothetical protein
MDAPIGAPPLAGQDLGAEAGAFVLAEWRDPGGPSGHWAAAASWKGAGVRDRCPIVRLCISNRPEQSAHGVPESSVEAPN